MDIALYCSGWSSAELLIDIWKRKLCQKNALSDGIGAQEEEDWNGAGLSECLRSYSHQWLRLLAWAWGLPFRCSG